MNKITEADSSVTPGCCPTPDPGYTPAELLVGPALRFSGFDHDSLAVYVDPRAEEPGEPLSRRP